MSIQGMNHFTVLSDDLDVTKQFYCDMLGLEPGPRPNFRFPGWWLYAGGTPVLHVIHRDKLNEVRAGVIDHMAFTATDLPGTVAKLQKAGVLDTLWQRDVDLGRYVGSHPMAGSHHSGPMTAHPDLFVDRTWVVTPHRRSAVESVTHVRAAVRACRAREVIMDVDDHDAAVARVSHLPHLMSVLVAGHLTRVPEGDLMLAGQGLRDVTRIAGSDPLLLEQILGANSTAVLEELRGVQDQLGLLIKAVEAAPATADLRSQLERGVAGTRKIGGKHGAAPVNYSEIVVAIPDSPGALARLFADVSAAGVNVEDVSIEHDPVLQIGYLAMSVAPEHADALVDTMLSHGWTVL